MTVLGPSTALPDDALSVLASLPEDTMALGGMVACLLRPGDTVLLGGDLGAGKTTFTKGMADALGVADTVTSPTFVLVHSYRTAAGWDLLHADVWRLEQLQEVIDLAIPELLEEGAAAVIEWGELAAPALAPDYLYVGISFDEVGGGEGPGHLGPGVEGPGGQERVAPTGAGGTRRLVFAALGPRWRPRMAQLAGAVGTR